MCCSEDNIAFGSICCLQEVRSCPEVNVVLTLVNLVPSDLGIFCVKYVKHSLNEEMNEIYTTLKW